MRRLLLIFLLVFLPLQTIWAAASPYCGHEAAPQVSHFGHHEHKHEHKHGHVREHLANAVGQHGEATMSPGDGGAPDVTALDGFAAGGAADIDCHACHGAGSGMALSMNAPALVVAVSRPAQQVPPARQHPPLSRPERPNWPAVA